MRNPYEVLGVREGAGVDEIRSAYRELVKKYHPDQYQNNPLSDLAQEKLKEINEAYDYLIKKAEANNRSSYSNNNSGYGQDNRGNNSYNQSNNRMYYDQARNYINRGNIGAAEDILRNVGTRDAEWHYLQGLIFSRKGWYNEAYGSLQNAVNMDPNNFEYRQALNNLSNTNRSYESTVYNRRHRGGMNGPDLCTICQCLYCSDCCCECAGGDLIDCC